MRSCIAGGRIGGTLLAWRLAQRPEVEHVDLLLGDERRADATELSEGVVVERRAGYVDATRLRSALIADLGARADVRVVAAPASAVLVHGDGTATVSTSGGRRTHDVAVLATGAWTSSVLAANGLPSTGGAEQLLGARQLQPSAHEKGNQPWQPRPSRP